MPRLYVYNAIFLLLIAPSFAAAGFFSDTETSPQQRFVASELQLEIDAVDEVVELGAAMPNASFALTASTTAASVPSVYDVSTTAVGGDASFCENITIETTAPGGAATTSDLASMITEPVSQYGEVTFTAVLQNPENVPHDATCEATFVFSAWQDNMKKGSAGYSDRKEITVNFLANQIVTNENQTNTEETVVIETVAGTSTVSTTDAEGSADNFGFADAQASKTASTTATTSNAEPVATSTIDAASTTSETTPITRTGSSTTQVTKDPVSSGATDEAVASTSKTTLEKSLQSTPEAKELDTEPAKTEEEAADSADDVSDDTDDDVQTESSPPAATENEQVESDKANEAVDKQEDV